MRSPANPADPLTGRILALLLLVVLSACDRPPLPGVGEVEGEGALQAITRPVEGGSVHQIRMTQQGDRYAFDPAEVSVRPGDVVRFVMVGSQPESVVFDLTGISADQASFITANALDRGILFTEPGATLDVSFRDAPPGSYSFRSVPHHEAGMEGTVHVIAEDP